MMYRSGWRARWRWPRSPRAGPPPLLTVGKSGFAEYRQPRVGGHWDDSTRLVCHEGMTAISPVICCSASGRPWAPARLYAIHQHVCTLAGLRVNRIPDLRHSYETIQLYENHAPIQYSVRAVGHSSIKITTYGHPCQGTSIALADQLDSPGGRTLRYAPSVQPERSRVIKGPVTSMA